ncbi:MAG: hypothetical protein HYZ73_09010 [Elusimicrobia bacterium]|nr:hypothetical protein [Elusimicrobiota bacterium]
MGSCPRPVFSSVSPNPRTTAPKTTIAPAVSSGAIPELPLSPCTLVIFGASGDLTHRKLVPALYRLHQQKLLPPGFSVVGFARTSLTHEQFR